VELAIFLNHTYGGLWGGAFVAQDALNNISPQDGGAQSAISGSVLGYSFVSFVSLLELEAR
jgi:hypothetical protein